MKKESQSMNTERLTIRISKELLEAAVQKSMDCGLSVSSFVRMLIAKEVKKVNDGNI